MKKLFKLTKIIKNIKFPRYLNFMISDIIQNRSKKKTEKFMLQMCVLSQNFSIRLAFFIVNLIILININFKPQHTARYGNTAQKMECFSRSIYFKIIYVSCFQSKKYFAITQDTFLTYFIQPS